MSDVIFDELERVRREIYTTFARTGRAPSRAEVAVAVGLGFDEVESAFARLAAHQEIVLGDYAQIDLAPPFASVNMGFLVSGANTLWWASSALGAFSIPHLVEAEPSVLVATTCPGCDAEMAWTVTRNAPPKGSQVAHFPTSAERLDVRRSSMSRRIFCDRVCVDHWLLRTGKPRGEVVGINMLWQMAAHWYDGLLQSPYVPRGPEESATYFAGLGLTGEFWGQPVEAVPRHAAHAR